MGVVGLINVHIHYAQFSVFHCFVQDVFVQNILYGSFTLVQVQYKSQ